MLHDILKSGHIWQGQQQASTRQPVLDTGFPLLNQHLPNHGWPQDGITEVIHSEAGMGELSLLLPALSHASERAYICLLSPPHELYQPTLTQHLNMQHTLVLQPKQTDVQWTAEQALRSGACHALVFWPHKTLNFTAYRRLQILCLEQKVPGFLFMRTAHANSPCRVRISIQRQSHHSLNVNVLKASGHVTQPRFTLPLTSHGYLRYPAASSSTPVQ